MVLESKKFVILGTVSKEKQISPYNIYSQQIKGSPFTALKSFYLLYLFTVAKVKVHLI